MRSQELGNIHPGIVVLDCSLAGLRIGITQITQGIAHDQSYLNSFFVTELFELVPVGLIICLAEIKGIYQFDAGDSVGGSFLGEIQGIQFAFEQFVGWPALQSAVEGAEVVLAPANLWFARGTNLNAVREVTLQSWARLMGWTVVEAING